MQIVQGHSEARLKVAARSRARPAIQTLDLKPGDLVEFYRDSPGKDVSGWRGPAHVVSLDRADEGIVEVRWQSRVLLCQAKDVRRALVYLTLLASPHRGEYPNGSPWQLVVEATLQLTTGSSLLLGLTRGSDMKWRTTPKTENNRRLYNA